MPDACVLWIPGHVPGPNQLNAMTLRNRMAVKKAMRDKAQALGIQWKHEHVERAGFTGPAMVTFRCIRWRDLDDDNLIGSLKYYRDGLVRAGLLPNGDGPKCGYVFTATQERGTHEDEGVHIRITTIGGPHGSPESTARDAAPAR